MKGGGMKGFGADATALANSLAARVETVPVAGLALVGAPELALGDRAGVSLAGPAAEIFFWADSLAPPVPTTNPSLTHLKLCASPLPVLALPGVPLGMPGVPLGMPGVPLGIPRLAAPLALAEAAMGHCCHRYLNQQLKPPASRSASFFRAPHSVRPCHSHPCPLGPAWTAHAHLCSDELLPAFLEAAGFYAAPFSPPLRIRRQSSDALLAAAGPQSLTARSWTRARSRSAILPPDLVSFVLGSLLLLGLASLALFPD